MKVVRRLCVIGCPALLLCVLMLAGSAVFAGGAGASIGYGSLSFVDRSHGWAAGIDGDTSMTEVWRTTDAARTWERVGSSLAAGGGIGWVAFQSASTGLWCNGSLLRTTTGGDSWDPTASPALGYYAGADFASAQRGWAARVNGSSEAGGGVDRTDDGGATWAVQLEKPGPDGSGGFRAVSSPTTARCYALKSGRDAGVYGTSTAGASWKRHVLPAYTKAYSSYWDIDFPSGRTGWAVGDAGRIVKTTNAGASWTRQKSKCLARLASVDFVDSKVGYVVGAGGRVLRTVDGGRHWVRVATSTTKGLRAVSFVDRTHGWVAGDRGVLLRTTNGGKTWNGQH